MITRDDLQNRVVSSATLDDRTELLSPRQRQVFEVIERYYSATGEPCSASYVARSLRLHHSTVQEHFSALHRKGWVSGPNAPAVPTHQRNDTW